MNYVSYPDIVTISYQHECHQVQLKLSEFSNLLRAQFSLRGEIKNNTKVREDVKPQSSWKRLSLSMKVMITT